MIKVSLPSACAAAVAAVFLLVSPAGARASRLEVDALRAEETAATASPTSTCQESVESSPFAFASEGADQTPRSEAFPDSECTDFCAEVFQLCLAEGGPPRFCLLKLRACLQQCQQD
jgi:hypothetical protein